jgi:hypothetical protein
MLTKNFKYLITMLFMIIAVAALTTPSDAQTFKKLQKPPFDEHTYGIYVGKNRVGSYSQKFTETADGYRVDATGGVKLKVMGFSKESSTKETYFVTSQLALRSFQISQTLNGVTSQITGVKYDTSLRIKINSAGKTTEKQARITGDIIPGPALNIYPLMQDEFIDKSFNVYVFDPEELRVEQVKISVFKEEKAPNGQPSLKMRNTLYPFVHNDIWIDANGNTLWESVRDGLVITKFEISRLLGHLK